MVRICTASCEADHSSPFSDIKNAWNQP